MDQRRNSTTTEDIAAVEDRSETNAVDPVDSDRTDADRVESHRIDSQRADFHQADSQRADSDLDDADLVDSDPHAHLDDEDRIDSDRVDSGRFSPDRADTDQTDTDGVESSRGDLETVDETARPADTTAAGQTTPRATGAAHRDNGAVPRDNSETAADVLFDEAEAERFRARWREVQTAFVDDPKRAVQDADVLVAELMQEMASAFSERKRVLEDKWREGTDAETEDLRLALRGYRSFVDQLLAH